MSRTTTHMAAGRPGTIRLQLSREKKLEDRWATQHLTAIMKCQGGCAYGKRKHCGARQLLPANSDARKRSLAHQTRPCASLK